MRVYTISSLVIILLCVSDGDGQLFNNRLKGLLNIFRPKPNVFNQRHQVSHVKRQNGPGPRLKKTRANIQARPRGFSKPKLKSIEEERFARAPVLKKYHPPIPSPSPIVRTTTTTRSTTTTTETTTTTTTASTTSYEVIRLFETEQPSFHNFHETDVKEKQTNVQGQIYNGQKKLIDNLFSFSPSDAKIQNQNEVVETISLGIDENFKLEPVNYFSQTKFVPSELLTEVIPATSISLITSSSDDEVHTFGDKQSVKQIDNYNYQQKIYEQQLRDINNPEDIYLKHMDQEKGYYDNQNQQPTSITKIENHPQFLSSEFQPEPETLVNNDQDAYYHQMLNKHHLEDYNQPSHDFQHVHLSEAEIEDIDYTNAPASLISKDDDDDAYEPNYETIDDDLEKKSVAKDEWYDVMASTEPHTMTTIIPSTDSDQVPDTFNGVTVNNDQATYIYEENKNYFTTESPAVQDVFDGISNEINDYYSDEVFDNEGIDDSEDKADVADYDLTPQLKSSIPNSDFKSDFFHDMNIQEVVFSIPSHFRKYLQEPPEWINKDYW